MKRRSLRAAPSSSTLRPPGASPVRPTRWRSSIRTKALDEGNFVTLEGDWTNRDERISEVLARYGRTGVPLYLVYSPSGEVTVLPELLTGDTVVEALRKAAQ